MQINNLKSRVGKVKDNSNTVKRGGTSTLDGLRTDAGRQVLVAGFGEFPGKGLEVRQRLDACKRTRVL